MVVFPLAVRYCTIPGLCRDIAAATVAAAKALGKTKGILLAHTNSSEIMLQKMGSSSRESVGYAAIIF